MEQNKTVIRECEKCKKIAPMHFIAGFSSRKEWSYYKCLLCNHKNDYQVEYEDENFDFLERWGY